MSSVASLETRKRPFSQKKGELSELRRSGFIPAVLYGGTAEPEGLSVLEKAFRKQMEIPGVRARVFSLGEGSRALVKDIQFDPVTDQPIHIDFFRLAKGAHVTVRVPLHFVNEEKSPGIKRGGVLNAVLHSLEISVDAEHIPDKIIVSLEGIEIGHSLHVKDLNLSKDIKLHHIHEEDTVVTVVAPSGLISAAGEEAEKANEEAEETEKKEKSSKGKE